MEFERNAFEQRKRDHIAHALDSANQAAGLSRLDRVHLVHEALPDLDFSEVSLASLCLGKPAATPFYVAGMTAGHADAPGINLALAEACEARGWAMGVGSQRRELEAGETGELDHWKQIRAAHPRLALFANLGISQAIRSDMARILRLAENLTAQALVIHLNALQEALQPEGTPQFKGGLKRLEQLCKELPIPVVLKETGCGFSRRTLARLRSIGLAAVDVSGLGGTHWGRIEGARAVSGSVQALASESFADWGEPTAECVLSAREALAPATEIWASGGVRSGLDAAKLIALGAHRVGYAKPALEAALGGTESLARWMEVQEYELKVALFCTGRATPRELRQGEQAWTRA
jgi:isopentenyl-diphosphate delta-isomerase